jgi:HK97 family phage prohead protease
MSTTAIEYDLDLIADFSINKVVDAVRREGPTRVIEGFAATTNLASDGAIITKEALEEARQDLLTRPTLLYNHDVNKPIGRVLEVQVKRIGKSEEYGLWIRALISQTAEETWTQIREGVLCKFSIRFGVTKQEDRFVERHKRSVPHITGLKIKEASVVTVPADTEADLVAWKVERMQKQKGGDPIMAEENKPEPVATAPVPCNHTEELTKLRNDLVAANTQLQDIAKNGTQDKQRADTLTSEIATLKAEVARRDSEPRGVTVKLAEIVRDNKASAEDKALFESLRSFYIPVAPAKDETGDTLKKIQEDLGNLRSAMDKIQVVKGEAPKGPSISTPAPVPTQELSAQMREEYERLDPQAKLQLLAGVVEKAGGFDVLRDSLTRKG